MNSSLIIPRSSFRFIVRHLRTSRADRPSRRRRGSHAEGSQPRGQKILTAEPLNLDGSARGDVILALDAADAGIGDRVLVVTEGWSAMSAVERERAPIDVAVIGVIDSVTLTE